LDTKDEEGATALMSAASNGHLKIVKYLVEKGAKVEEKDDQHMDALAWAAYSDEPAVVNFLKSVSNHKEIEGDLILRSMPKHAEKEAQPKPKPMKLR